MARKYGRCANYGECALADSHKVIDASEDSFVCPECGKPLRAAAEPTPAAGKKPVTMLGWFLPLLLLLLVGGGLAAWQLGVFSSPGSSPQPDKAAGNVSPAQPAAVVPAPVVAAKQASGPNIILRLHGSNTIGEKLAPALVEAFMKDKGYMEIGKTPVGDLEVLITGKKPGATATDAIEIKAHGSATAFDETDKNAHVGLLGGYADVGMASSPVKQETIEKFQAKKLGDPSSRMQEHIIALDGLAVIVNPGNPADKLSVDSIRKVFAGEITDWSSLGGQPGQINLYSRDHQSGTYDTFKHLVLAGKQLDCGTQPHLQCFEDSKELSSHVASDPQGIGFIGLNYIGTAKALKVSMGDKVNALAPGRFAVKTEDYPLSRRLFLYQTNQPTPLAAGFIQFALSDAGQKVVDDVGLVSVGIGETQSAQDVSEADADKRRLLDDAAVPKAYKELIRAADRKDTPLNFRFQSGSSDLDNRAYRDVGRLAEKLGKAEFNNARLVLIGFADPKGDAEKNVELSRQRAMEVQGQLEAEGLKVESAGGFGEEPSLLLDSREDDPDSLAKNRRVEVWLKR